MGDVEIEVQVFDRFQAAVPAEWLRHVARTTLESEVPESGRGLSIVVADDETVQDLNRRYRGLDETTDVLAFPFDVQAEYHDEATAAAVTGVGFVLPPELTPAWGEVVLSYPQVERQARQAGRPVERELALMVVHGILHLLGYDHAEPEEEALMTARQQGLLRRLFPCQTEGRAG